MAWDISSVSSSVLDWLIIIASFILAGAFALGVWSITKHIRRFKEYKVVIWEKDGFDQWSETTDQGGVYVDKATNNKRLFLKKCNVGLTADNVPYLPGKKGSKIVYLLRTGLKNFHFIRINPAYPTVTLQVGEEDVNWAINAYERQKKLGKSTLLEKLLDHLPMIIGCMVILVIFIYFFKNLSSLVEFGQYMKEIAQIMLQTKTGVIPSP